LSQAEALDALNALSAEQLNERLSGSAEARAAFVAAAAEAGVAEAQALYGHMLLDGNGVAADPRAALLWFAAAAKQGHVLAINMVGRCYDLGWGTGVDKKKAADWYRLAAERGLDWGMYNYATLLTLGEGIGQDRAEALDWFRRAAALGNAKAVNFVGSFHEDGWVVERDLGQAAACYLKAAEGGDFRGQFNHARMLLDQGRMDEALSWLERSAATATPRFAAQAAHWLGERDDPLFRAAAGWFEVAT
jgi:TPR repeat protein